jgi:hypothetical protein
VERQSQLRLLRHTVRLRQAWQSSLWPLRARRLASAAAAKWMGDIDVFTDSSGATNYGADFQAGLAHVNVSVGHFGFDTGVTNVDTGIYVSKSDATFSAEANLVDGAVSIGNEGNQLRAGASVGVGGALRAHFGRNSDWFRSVGIGADFPWARCGV